MREQTKELIVEYLSECSELQREYAEHKLARLSGIIEGRLITASVQIDDPVVRLLALSFITEEVDWREIAKMVANKISTVHST